MGIGVQQSEAQGRKIPTACDIIADLTELPSQEKSHIGLSGDKRTNFCHSQKSPVRVR